MPVQFTAAVTGDSNASVTWSIKGYPGENDGTISAAGVYTPPVVVPTHNTISIIATSVANPATSSSTSLTILNPTPVIASATATRVASSALLLDVKGTGFNQASLLQVGGYTVPSTLVSTTEITYTLTNVPAPGAQIALSVMNQSPGRTQGSVYALTTPATVGVTVTGVSTATLGTAAQYAAAVTGTTNTAVTWTVQGYTGENFGSISSTGLYTPPATVPVHNVITLKVASQVDASKSATASLTILNKVPSIVSATGTPQAHNTVLLTVTGTNFGSNSVLQVGGYTVASTVVSATAITYSLTNAPAPGTTLSLSVMNQSPGRTQGPVYGFTVPNPVAVTVTGSTAATLGTPVQFSAAVTGSTNTAVTWTVQGYTGENFGSISSTGLYTLPSAVPVHTAITVTATSQADTTKSASATITLSNPVPVISSVSTTPGSNGSLVFAVHGSNFLPVSSLAIGGYGVTSTVVSSTQIAYTMPKIPASGTQLALSVVSASPGKAVSSTYTLNYTGGVSVAVTGNTQATIGTPVQYTANVSGTTNTAVTWSLKGGGQNFGSLSSTGLYTPPSAVPADTSVVITATSQLDSTKSSSETVTIVNPVPAISAVTVTRGTANSLVYDVVGSNFLSISSLAIGGYGVPSTIVSPTEIKYVATTQVPAVGSSLALSVVTPAPGKVISTVYNVTVPPLVAVSVTGASQTTTVGSPVQFTAAVTGTPNTAVTWTAAGSPGQSVGSISASGLYTAPAVVPPSNVITITATSQYDTSKTSSAQITVMNNVPVITAATATASGHYFLLTITGTNFLPKSSVQFQGAGLGTTYVSPTSLTALIQTAQTLGSQVSFYVVNPNPGTTQSASFNVTIPGLVGVSVVGQPLVAIGSTAQFFSTVTGTSNTAVTWSLGAGSVGTLSSTGLYTPPATISANATVQIIATSQVEASQSGTANISVVATSTAAATRLLEQSSFGPTDAEVAHVQSIGLSAYLNEQIATPATLMPLLSNPLPTMCTGNGHICDDLNFYSNAVTAPDQLRQRVAFALGEIFVVSRLETNDYTIAPYVNNLANDAFGNWFTIMKDVTLSPAMGAYLNMVNSGKAPAGQIANENFARENMQLFNIGLNLLNQDGTVQTDGQGNPIPAYSEAQVEAFARAFTGWTWANAGGSAPGAFPNWGGSLTTPLLAVESQHDTTSKVLLNSTLPAGQTAEQDVVGALTDVFNHPNVGPFVSTQLIRHLVKSNPSPAYVSRVAAVFANDGNGVRGNMAAVITAILLDEEARAGDVAPVATDGHLREPILWMTSVLRALNAVPKPTVTDNSAYTSIPSMAAGLGQMDFQSPTVFNFFPSDWQLQGTNLIAPEFALETSATIMGKLNLANSIVDNLIGKLTVDLSATGPLGVLASTSNDALLDELNKLLLHGQMSTQMRSTISSTISGITDPAQRVRMAVYLVITSTQYKVIH